MIILMRLIHILSGVAWAGGAFMMAGFVEPSARAIGPDGGKFMRQLAGPGRYSLYMTVGGTLATLSGIYLYWIRSGGIRIEWLSSGQGLAFTIGSVAGIIAAVYGTLVPRKAAQQMAQLGRQIQSAGGPPNPEQMAQMQSLQNKLAQSGRNNALLLIITVIGMSIAEHL